MRIAANRRSCAREYFTTRVRLNHVGKLDFNRRTHGRRQDEACRCQAVEDGGRSARKLSTTTRLLATLDVGQMLLPGHLPHVGQNLAPNPAIA